MVWSVCGKYVAKQVWRIIVLFKSSGIFAGAQVTSVMVLTNFARNIFEIYITPIMCAYLRYKNILSIFIEYAQLYVVNFAVIISLIAHGFK